MDLYQLKREFLEHCELEKGQSQATINSYSHYLDRFFEFVEDSQKTNDQGPRTEDQSDKNGSGRSLSSSVISPEHITQEMVRKYRLHVNRLRDNRGKELKTTTQNFHILALRAFLRYLAFRGVAALSPEKIPVAKIGDREINFLESEEVKNILQTSVGSGEFGPRDRAILATLFSTGLRVSELVALNVDDLNFERGEIAVLGKGKKIRLVFLSHETTELLSAYLAERGIPTDKNINLPNEPLFLSFRNTRLTVRSIERTVKKYAAVAGITKNVSPHTLRHSFATDLLMSGADIRSVQSLLGHASISTTQVYTHVTDSHLREIHQRFHGKSLLSGQDEEGGDTNKTTLD